MGSLHVERRIKASCGDHKGCTWRDNLWIQVKIHVRCMWRDMVWLHVEKYVKIAREIGARGKHVNLHKERQGILHVESHVTKGTVI